MTKFLLGLFLATTAQAFVPNGVSLNGNSVGSLRVLVVLLEWSDQVSKPKPSYTDYDETWNGQGVSTNIPAGSISNWTNANSYGKLMIEANVVDWYPTDNTEFYYANGQRGIPYDTNPINIASAFVPVLDHLDSTGFDFSPFDQNQDSVLDVVVFLHSGYSSELEGTDCNTGATTDNRIQSFAGSVLGSPVQWISARTGYRLGTYVVASGLQGTCGSTIAKIGVMTHEFLHTFGLPDLYDKEGKYNNNPALGGLAGFEIMANPGGQTNKLGFPAHTSPWCKMQLGWLSPTEITADGTYTMRASELYPDVFKISAGYNSSAGEYLLIENRQPLLFDIDLWTGGPLIYHVDESAGPGNNYRGFPGMSGWPGNGKHYAVALLQADGQYRLEQSLSNGDAAMFWLAGTTLGPGNGETVSSSSGTYPNTDSYAGGNIKTTGITLTNFVEISPMVWSFDVKGLPPVAPSTPIPAPVAPTPHPVFAPVPVPTSSAPLSIAPTLAPIAPTPAPVPSTPAPVSASPAPALASPAPIAATTSAPTVATPGPVSATFVPSTLAPSAGSSSIIPSVISPITPAPIFLIPTQGGSNISSAPALITPAPVFVIPTVITNGTAAPVAATRPPVSSNKPVTAKPKPISPTRAPSSQTAPPFPLPPTNAGIAPSTPAQQPTASSSSSSSGFDQQQISLLAMAGSLIAIGLIGATIGLVQFYHQVHVDGSSATETPTPTPKTQLSNVI